MNCYYLARELAKRHEVHIFCSGSETKDEIIDKIHVHRHKELLRIKYYLAFYPRIVHTLMQSKLDILHVHGFGFLQHDYAIRRLKKAQPALKLVCTPHGPFMALKSYGFTARLFRSIYTPRIQKNIQSYDRIIAVNPKQHLWMKKLYSIPQSKIRVVPNGISKEALVSVGKKEQERYAKHYGLQGTRVISYLGRIQAYKGIDQTIRALPATIKKIPNTLLLIMGKDSGDRARLEQIAQELGITKNVFFTGVVSEREKRALLSLTDIFVFPSEWEAFGIVVLEAMAQGAAIISTKTEGGTYLVIPGVNGYLYEFGDINALTKKLLSILKKPALRKRMGKANKKKAKNFLWIDIAHILEKVYVELM